MVYYANKTPGRLAQVLRANSNLSEEYILKYVEKPYRFSDNFGSGRYGLTQFEERAVLTALADIYQKESHKPLGNEVPVTILLEAILSSYDFENQRATIVINKINTVDTMPGRWWEKQRKGERVPLGGVAYLNIPEEQANAIYTAAKSNPLGSNVFFVGVETSLPLLHNAEFVDIDRVIYSFSWDMKNPFFVYDVAARKRERQALETQQREVEGNKLAAEQLSLEKKRTDILEREAGGFNFEENAARFESSGLQIGAPPPETLEFTRYEAARYNLTKNGTKFPATRTFFHAEFIGGEVAFITSDGDEKSPVIYYARYFSGSNLSREALRKAAQKKLGQPQHSGSYDAYWWDTGVPEDRLAACRVEIFDVGLGSASLSNNEWTRHPLLVDFTKFPKNCGIVAAMSFRGKRYAVADTTFLNKYLLETRAEEQRNTVKREAEAESEIKF